MRNEIVEEYQADFDPTIKCPDVFAEQTTLMIDFSSRAAESVVRQMENFRGIRRLILTGGASSAEADLPAVLGKAKNYPLSELYIINFRKHVAAVPPEVLRFRELRVLAVFANAITALPPDLDHIHSLETLLADANPLTTILPAVRDLPKLARLGIGRTGISAAEVAEIKRLRPACEVLDQ